MTHEQHILTVSASDFEGRHYWIDEEAGQACIKKDGAFHVRLPPPLDTHLVQVTAQTWNKATKTRLHRPRRRLATPSSFLQPIDDPTVTWSLTASGENSRPPPPTSTLFLYPEEGLERVATNVETQIDDLQRALLDYARLLADQRWEKRVDWTVLCKAYPSLLLGPPEHHLRLAALLLTARLTVAPMVWLAHQEQSESNGKIVAGIDEIFPPFFHAFFAAEEAIVAAQCRAEVLTPEGALACLRVAQRAYPRALSATQLAESNSTFGARPRFTPNLETRLLAGLGIVATGPVEASDLCRLLIPRLHARALKREVLQWVREFAQTASHVTSEDALLAGMHPNMAWVWRIARDARPFIREALECASPAEFFLGKGRQLGPSAVPGQVASYVRASALSDGTWRAPLNTQERLLRTGALDMDMEDLFKAAPPCMAQVLQKARTQRKLKNADSYPLSRWLAACFPGRKADDIGHALFGHVSMDSPDERRIIDAVKRAQVKGYAPDSCLKIIQLSPNDDVALHCPYASLATLRDAGGNGLPVETACVTCYAKDKGLDVVPPPLRNPLDHVLFYKGQ